MRSMAKRRVGGATRASAQNGLLSPMPCAQWRMASRVATSMYGSGRGTALPIRERSASRASDVMVGNRVVDMAQLWSGLRRGSRHDVAVEVDCQTGRVVRRKSMDAMIEESVGGVLAPLRRR